MSAPSARLDDAVLDGIETLLRDECGLTFSEGIRGALGPSVGAAAAALGVPIDAFLARLAAREALAIATLVDHAVVPETYFFRHPDHFRLLSDRLLPSLADRPSLRIWSAGCATGEEPYSLAIALLEAGRTPGDDLVIGTDVSERLLARARAGRYGRWSFRHVAADLLERHFHADDGRFEVAEAVRRTVTFRRQNLIADPPPVDDCDLVVCRNVLIYFAPVLARRVLAGLSAALRPGGVLLVAPAELPLATGLGLEPEEHDGATWLRRATAAAGRKPEPRAGPAATRRSAPRPAPLRIETPAPAPARVEAVGPPAPAATSAYDRAVVAATDGRLDEALALAREATRELAAPPHLLLALLADASGDEETALDAIRRALYLDPGDALAHATQARFLDRAGRVEEARRSRANARQALGNRDDDELLPGPAPLTVGALRRALGDG